MHDAAKRNIVRISSETGETFGSGFLIAADLVLSCAHVVALAAGVDESSPTRPVGPVHIDFPFRGDVDATGFVSDDCVWSPVDKVLRKGVFPSPDKDLAMVRLDRKITPFEEIQFVKPSDAAVTPDGFKVYGFPSSPGKTVGIDSRGEFAYGLIRDEIAAGWIQLEQSRDGVQVQPGFSGSALWNCAQHKIAGLVVEYDQRPTRAASAMISATALAAVIPQISAALRPPISNARRLMDHASAERLISLCDRREQYEDLVDSYKKLDDKSRVKPFAWIVYGDTRDWHRGFALRFENEIAAKCLGEGRGKIAARPVQLEWPAGSKVGPEMSRRLDGEIRSASNLGSDDTTPLFFKSMLITNQWEDGGAGAIRHFGNFWRRQILSPARAVFACLEVQSAPPAAANFIRKWVLERSRQGVDKLIKDLLKPNAPIGCKALPPLGCVVQSHVYAWAESEIVKESAGSFDFSAIDRIFDDSAAERCENGWLRLQYVAERLQRTLCEEQR